MFELVDTDRSGFIDAGDIGEVPIIIVVLYCIRLEYVVLCYIL